MFKEYIILFEIINSKKIRVTFLQWINIIKLWINFANDIDCTLVGIYSVWVTLTQPTNFVSKFFITTTQRHATIEWNNFYHN
jgi:hypothetical protein